MLTNVDVYIDYISGFIFDMVQKYESAHTVCRHSLFAFFKMKISENKTKQKSKVPVGFPRNFASFCQLLN